MKRPIIPVLNLSIKGNPVEDGLLKLIEEYTYVDTTSGSNTFEFTLNDPDFKFISNSYIVENTPVAFSLGLFGSAFRAEFDGFISAVDINFPDTGIPQVVVMCMDRTHLLNGQKKTRKFPNKHRSEVAQQIAKEHGLKAVVDKSTGEKEESLSQSNVTDIEYLINLAREEKELFMVYVEGTTLYYVKKKLLDKEQMSLYYRRNTYDIKDYTPSINIETKKEETKKATVVTTSSGASGKPTPETSVNTGTGSSSTTAVETQGTMTGYTTDRESDGVWSTTAIPKPIGGVAAIGSNRTTAYTTTDGNVWTQTVREAVPPKVDTATSETKPSSTRPASSTSSGNKISGNNAKPQADKEYKEITEYALVGDANININHDNFSLMAKKNVRMEGFGPVLSGLSYVEEVTRKLSKDDGLSMSITLSRNGFGPSMVSASVVVPQPVSEAPAVAASSNTSNTRTTTGSSTRNTPPPLKPVAVASTGSGAGTGSARLTTAVGRVQ